MYVYNAVPVAFVQYTDLNETIRLLYLFEPLIVHCIVSFPLDCLSYIHMIFKDIWHSWMPYLTREMFLWDKLFIKPVRIITCDLTFRSTCVHPRFFNGVRATRSLVLCVRFCRSLFVLLAIALSVLLRFMDSDYPFGILKLFLPIIYVVILFMRFVAYSQKPLNYLAFQSVDFERIWWRNPLRALK